MDYCSWHNVMQEGYLVSELFFLFIFLCSLFLKSFFLKKNLLLVRLSLSFNFIDVVVGVVDTIQWFLCSNLRVWVCMSECLPSFAISFFFFSFASCNLVSGSTPDGYIEESIFYSGIFLLLSFFLSFFFLFFFVFDCCSWRQTWFIVFSMFVYYICKIFVVCAIWFVCAFYVCVRKKMNVRIQIKASRQVNGRTGAHLQILWLFFRPCSHNQHSTQKIGTNYIIE